MKKGILFGIVCTLLMLAIALFTVATSPSLYSKESLGISEAQAQEYIDNISGRQGAQDGALRTFGIVLRVGIAVFSLASAAAIALEVISCRGRQTAEKEERFHTFGRAALLVQIILIVAAVAATLILINSGLSALLTTFVRGSARFFALLMLLPLFIAYKFAYFKKKSDNVNDDYMYQ